MNLVVRPLTADRWPALEDLFATSGPVGRCWCMYWRIGSKYRHRSPATNAAAFREVVNNGPPPGLLAFYDGDGDGDGDGDDGDRDGDTAVGWCQLTPRDDLPYLDRLRPLRRIDAAPVWSISCFYVRKGHRRQGVATALIIAAIAAAGDAGAVAVEAYPLDAGLTPSASPTGFASTFARLGFTTVARHVPARPIMRYELRPPE